MDKENQRNKKNNYIQDARAYYNEELKKKRDREEQNFNEKQTKINTSLMINELEKNEQYKKNFMRREENIDKHIGSYLDYNQHKDIMRSRYGNRELYDQAKNSPISIQYSILLIYLLL